MEHEPDVPASVAPAKQFSIHVVVTYLHEKPCMNVELPFRRRGPEKNPKIEAYEP